MFKRYRRRSVYLCTIFFKKKKKKCFRVVRLEIKEEEEREKSPRASCTTKRKYYLKNKTFDGLPKGMENTERKETNNVRCIIVGTTVAEGVRSLRRRI